MTHYSVRGLSRDDLAECTIIRLHAHSKGQAPHIFLAKHIVKTGSSNQIFIHFGIPSNAAMESCLTHFGAKGIIIIFMNLLLFSVFFLATSQTCILPEAKMITGF